MEFSGGAHGILTNHGIRDEENLAGLQLFLQHAQLVHQFIVDVQAAGGVHEDHVAGGKFRFLDGAFDDFERFIRARARPNCGTDCFGNLGELFAGGGTINVRGNDDGPVSMLGKPFGELARSRGLTGALQTDNHPHRRRARGKERLGVLAKHGGEFVANHLDNLLVR